MRNSIRQLTAGLDLLSEQPEIARERSELHPPVRIHPVASHLIVYRIEADHLDIIRIRHGREDWARDYLSNDPLGDGQTECNLFMDQGVEQTANPGHIGGGPAMMRAAHPPAVRVILW